MDSEEFVCMVQAQDEVNQLKEVKNTFAMLSENGMITRSSLQAHLVEHEFNDEERGRICELVGKGGDIEFVHFQKFMAQSND